ncbi:MAG: exopolysaccharide Pel transporter PelG [Lachnospiraceae bacterium]|nr:exopolysaccharide Pel transporter PelG [Lachnospiraceae bacterium]
MAGIGVKLNRIFSKNTITTSLVGFGYSSAITIAPMCLIITTIIIMQRLLGFTKLGYAVRELFACTVLYIFIFALLTSSPFNAVLSRYLSDVIYEETYDDILPCFFTGLILNILLSCLVGIPFCVFEYLAGEVALFYVFAGYCGYVALVLVFYSMLYLSICKDYNKISLFFLIGMLTAVILSLVLVYLGRVETTFAMLASLDTGFVLIACLELALIKSYFRKNSGKYKIVFRYLGKYWQLIATNFLYTLGLFIHNFVFWTTDMRIVVAGSFVCATPYDMATCLAMFTNLSASVIFITRVEMHFHERYRKYSEAVIGGRGNDIANTKKRMFYQLSEELMNLVRLQFIVSVVLYFACIILLPQFGFGGMVIRIYPCLAAGYFILFIMYSAIIFLYYFNDLNGSVMTSLGFCLVTLLGSICAARLSPIWYGIGLVAGAMTGWCIAYCRLRNMERNLDIHVFCEGNILKKGHGKPPSGQVYSNPFPAAKRKRKIHLL